MPNLQERRNKDGKLISYSIRVHRGRGADGKQLPPFTATFQVLPSWSEKSARKRAEAFAICFERDCKEGIRSDSRQRFDAYCDYVLSMKEQRGVKHSTLVRYRALTKRIYPAIGHLKLKDIRPDIINNFYSALMTEGEKQNGGSAKARIDLESVLNERKINRAQIAESASLSVRAVSFAVRGDTVSIRTAKGVSAALGLDLEDAFSVTDDGAQLSPKTVREYHGLISSVLQQAVKEGLISVNPAARATPPKVERKVPNYFQPETVLAIRDALETEPLKWKALVHLMLITGARRGEILGLKWRCVDFERGQIHICNTVQYTPERGIYEDTPKTASSDRFVSLPAETMALLRQYRAWQSGERMRLAGYYQDRDFVFAADDGGPIHPSGVGKWLTNFSKRHNLPHLNPHGFRHTAASLLYFAGADAVSISARLGHSQVSTTSNIYAHVIEQSDKRNADLLEAAIFKKKA